jgi:hypothetical protein
MISCLDASAQPRTQALTFARPPAAACEGKSLVTRLTSAPLVKETLTIETCGLDLSIILQLFKSD